MIEAAVQAEQDQTRGFDFIARVHEGRGRSAYSEVRPGMTLAQVGKMPGSGEEVASSIDAQVFQWEYEYDNAPYDDTHCVITGSFAVGMPVSKSIVRY